MRELREWLLGRLRLSRDEREGSGLRGSKEDAVQRVCTYVCVTEGCVCVRGGPWPECHIRRQWGSLERREGALLLGWRRGSGQSL